MRKLFYKFFFFQMGDQSKTLLTLTCLLGTWLLGFSSRLFAVIRFESIIHEFDPWFNYKATHHLTEHGFYEFLNWFDETAWYPLGRIVGGTVYPGLMMTAGLMHWLSNSLGFTGRVFLPLRYTVELKSRVERHRQSGCP